MTERRFVHPLPGPHVRCDQHPAFEPWLTRIETKITEETLDEISKEIPGEWYNFETETLEKMLEQLLRRRKLVRELIVSAWKSSRQPFPNWK